jgi:hypothetical protein
LSAQGRCYQFNKSRVLLQGDELKMTHENAIRRILYAIDGSTIPWDIIQQVPDHPREITAMLNLARSLEFNTTAITLKA